VLRSSVALEGRHGMFCSLARRPPYCDPQSPRRVTATVSSGRPKIATPRGYAASLDHLCSRRSSGDRGSQQRRHPPAQYHGCDGRPWGDRRSQLRHRPREVRPGPRGSRPRDDREPQRLRRPIQGRHADVAAVLATGGRKHRRRLIAPDPRLAKPGIPRTLSNPPPFPDHHVERQRHDEAPQPKTRPAVHRDEKPLRRGVAEAE
jgi:hypothetical protein